MDALAGVADESSSGDLLRWRPRSEAMPRTPIRRACPVRRAPAEPKSPGRRGGHSARSAARDGGGPGQHSEETIAGLYWTGGSATEALSPWWPRGAGETRLSPSRNIRFLRNAARRVLNGRSRNGTDFGARSRAGERAKRRRQGPDPGRSTRVGRRPSTSMSSSRRVSRTTRRPAPWVSGARGRWADAFRRGDRGSFVASRPRVLRVSSRCHHLDNHPERALRRRPRCRGRRRGDPSDARPAHHVSFGSGFLGYRADMDSAERGCPGGR